jgi:PAS domain S-box-containing protein
MTDSATDNRDASIGDLYQINRLIADTASDAIITIDQDSRILFVNQAAEKIFGYSRAEMLGQSLTILMPEYLRHVHRAGLRRYLETGERHISWEAVTLPGRRKNGAEVPLELSFGEFSENGRRFFTGIVRDVTGQQRLQQRLTAQYRSAQILAEAESLEKSAPLFLQAICESLGWELGQIWLANRDANVLRWLASWSSPSLPATEFEEASRNRTFVRGVGLPGRIWDSGAADWIKDISTDQNFPRAEYAARAGLNSAFGFPVMLGNQVSGVMEFFSCESQTPDQTLLEVMAGIGNQVGQFVGRQVALAERERLAAQERQARREAEVAVERLRSVQRVTDVALAHLSLDELLAESLDRVRDAMLVDTVVILLLEQESNELVAWAAKGLEEEVERGVRIPIGSGFAGRVAAEKAPVLIDDLDRAEVCNPLLKQKGIHSLLGVPLLVEGRVIGVIHVGKLTPYQFTDNDTRLLQLVADRIALAIDNARLFEEERSARRDAEASNRAKDEFLTTISHELRTPLTPVIGWLHMIRSGILPEAEMQRGLSVIEKNSQALKRLINDLLDMSAILSGKMRMEDSPVHLDEVVREALETVRPLAEARDIHLDLAFQEWQNEIVSGDRARLVQVFWNLLHNAIKFSQEGGRVRVNCEANHNTAVVRIEDSGQGIRSEFLPFVFERFRQADGSKTRAHGGLGLGLSLVKSFVEAHRGTIHAKSEGLGRGSCFTVRLPRWVPAGEAITTEKIEVESEAPSRRVHLMVIDDDVDTLDVLKSTLEASGFRVTACESSAAALEAAQQDSFDLIISDIGMPKMDGMEMIGRMRQIEPLRETPAIALSGYASQRDSKAALTAGFNAHVAKPVDPKELKALIDRLLQQAGNPKD